MWRPTVEYLCNPLCPDIRSINGSRSAAGQLGGTSFRALSITASDWLPLLPRRYALLVLHRIAETFGLYAQLSERIERHQSAMRIERHNVSENTSKCESFGWLTEGVDERVIPCG